MSDGAISQDEIDALLSGVAIDGLNSSGHVGNGPSYHFDIPTLQTLADALKPKLEENINKTTSVTFTTEAPVVEQTNRDHVLSKLPEVVIGINADYNAGIKGSHLYLMAPEFALKIFQLVSSEEATEVDDMVLSVVSEFVATHISAEIQEVEGKGKVSGLGYGTPETLNESKAMIMFPQGDFVLASYPLTYEGNAYTLWECLGGDAAEGLTKALGGGADDSAGLTPIDLGGMNAAAAGGQAMGAAPMGGMQQMGGAMPNMGMGMQQPMGGMQQMGMGMPMGGMGMGMPQNMGVNMGMNVPNVQQLQYPNLQAGLNAGEQGNISLIMDVFMEMTVELGRTKKTIKDILGMGEGTIIELDKLAGEPVDILVNHKKIAKGEVVVIDENFGVRVTEILSPMERVSELN
ncbi:flagellar motor switch protein FliN/FliY [Treponema bryantii]|uniref:Flagellar motor switch protein FliN n=1 Tax=Treponema bryantii TaxID=163 RepID=A0A1I3IUL1_9SPIR|nr:flagellar motor switch protein FliN [Treponema bryantii]SFI51550.1 flagellar motor switch protein FliN/FliY [Treponema bryantii]